MRNIFANTSVRRARAAPTHPRHLWTRAGIATSAVSAGFAVTRHRRPCLDPHAQHPHVAAHPQLRQDQRVAARVRVAVAWIGESARVQREQVLRALLRHPASMPLRGSGTVEPRRPPGPRQPPTPAGGCSVGRRRGDRVLSSSAVLRSQADTSPSAIGGRVCRLRRRVPGAASGALAAFAAIARPGAVPPRRRVGLDARTAAAPIRRRAIPVRRHQPATPDARHVSTARHWPTPIQRFCFCGKPGGRCQCHGWRRGGALWVTRPGVLVGLVAAGWRGWGGLWRRRAVGRPRV